MIIDLKQKNAVIWIKIMDYSKKTTRLTKVFNTSIGCWLLVVPSSNNFQSRAPNKLCTHV